MSLPVFLLLAAGLQYLLGAAAITAPLRAPLPAIARTLLECSACCGFWIGIGAALVGLGPGGLDALPGGLFGRIIGTGVLAMAGTPLIRFFGPDAGGRTGGS